MVKEALDRAVRHQRDCAKRVMRGKADCAPVLVAFLASTAPGWRRVAMIRPTSSYSERIGRISRWVCCGSIPLAPAVSVERAAVRGRRGGGCRAWSVLRGVSVRSSPNGNRGRKRLGEQRRQQSARRNALLRWCGPSAAAVKTVWRTSSTMPVSKKSSDREEGQCRRLV